MTALTQNAAGRKVPKIPRFALPSDLSGVAGVAAAALRLAFGRRRSPANPMNAGSSVSARTTSSATATAPKAPITVRKGTLARLSPIRAMTTVRPANTTAEPAVPTERAADSSTAMPAESWSR